MKSSASRCSFHEVKLCVTADVTSQELDRMQRVLPDVVGSNSALDLYHRSPLFSLICAVPVHCLMWKKYHKTLNIFQIPFLPSGYGPPPNQWVLSCHRLPVLRPEAWGCGACHEGTYLLPISLGKIYILGKLWWKNYRFSNLHHLSKSNVCVLWFALSNDGFSLGLIIMSHFFIHTVLFSSKLYYTHVMPSNESESRFLSENANMSLGWVWKRSKWHYVAFVMPVIVTQRLKFETFRV